MDESSPTALRLAANIEARRSRLTDPQMAHADPRTLTDEETEQLATAPRRTLSADTDEVDALLRALEEVTAVSGRVQIAQLAPKTAGEVRESALSRLAPSCIVERRGDGVWWLLTRRPRCLVLSRLAEEDRLASLLAGPLPATDEFGRVLRELLHLGSATPMDRPDPSELLELITAVELISDTSLPHPDLATLREKLGQTSAIEDYTAVLPEDFVGRAAELSQLEAFLRRLDSEWTGAVVTGLGGAGKSALVAKFVSDVVARGEATVLVLDFDRPGIDPRDSYWLGLEVTRQVGQRYPAVGGRLRSARQQTRLKRSWRKGNLASASSEAAQSLRTEGSLLWQVQPALEQAGAKDRPVLVVLDTFEEVIQHQHTDFVQNWLDQLADALFPIPLKVVYAGRLFDLGLQQISRRTKDDRIELSELDTSTAAALLRSVGVPVDLAQRLATSAVLPRRPLELRLLARVLQDDPDTSVEALEESLRSGGAAARETFAALVYRRVLLRIRDQTVRALAYPGLVLRYVTADLIQRVLAPALDLPAIDEDDARRLLEQLASCEWLVFRTADGAVWHRRDLRRSMLKVMLSVDAERGRRVSSAAIKYFAALPTPAARAEAVYHRLLHLQPDESEAAPRDLSAIVVAAQYIQADTADLSPSGAALFRFATEEALPVEGIRALPRVLRHDAYSAAGTALIASREFTRALAVVTAMETDESIHGTDFRNAAWQFEARFATADWATLDTWDPAYLSNRLVSTDLAFPLLAAAGRAPDAESFASLLARQAVWLLDASDVTRLSRAWSSELDDTLLSRVVMNAILLETQNSAVAGLRGLTSRLLEAVQGRRSLPPTLGLRLAILTTAHHGRLPRDIDLATPTICIDGEWLSRAAMYGGSGGDSYFLESVARALYEAQAGSPRERLARRLLAAVDRMALPTDAERKDGSQSIRLRGVPVHEAVRILRGPDPELRDPARFALLEAYPDDAGRRRLGAILQDVIAFELSDLDPGRFAATVGPDPEHLLEGYIELVDRAWRLGELLRRVREDRPRAAKVAMVHRAWERWNEAVQRALEAGPGHEPALVRQAVRA